MTEFLKTYDCLVAAGTTEAYEVIEALLKRGFQVYATAATPMGREMLDDLMDLNSVENHTFSDDRKDGRAYNRYGSLTVEVGRKDEAAFIETLKKTKAKFCVDATHPFAVEVTKTIKSAAQKGNIPYFRYLRPQKIHYETGDSIQIIDAADAADAARRLGLMPGRFLLTTGANTIDVYMNAITDFNERGYVRVLDTEMSRERCAAYGVPDSHVIAANPPFSMKDTLKLLRDLDIQILVSKDSGKNGGLEEKLEAARLSGIPVILIRRPVTEEGYESLEKLMQAITDEKCFDEDS